MHLTGSQGQLGGRCWLDTAPKLGEGTPTARRRSGPRPLTAIPQEARPLSSGPPCGLGAQWPTLPPPRRPSLRPRWGGCWLRVTLPFPKPRPWSEGSCVA